MQEELDVVQTKIKNRNIPPEVWKTRKFKDILLRYFNAIDNQNTIDRWKKGCILPFPKKGDLGIAKNYQVITLTSIAINIYNVLLLNCIEPEIEKILRKNPNGFCRNITHSDNPLNFRRCSCKKLWIYTLICRFFPGIWLHTQSEDGVKNTSSLQSTQGDCCSHNDSI